MNTIIRTPTHHDVLFGRGGSINAHEGNILFRHVVNQYKDAYMRASKHSKPTIANEVVSVIYNLNPPGRFLAPISESQKNYKKNGSITWYNVGLKKARAKASQCLRERIRNDAKHKKDLQSRHKEQRKYWNEVSNSSIFSSHSRSNNTMVLKDREEVDIERRLCFYKRDGDYRHIYQSRTYGFPPRNNAFLFPPTEIMYTRFHSTHSVEMKLSDQYVGIPSAEDQEQIVSCTSWIGSFFSVEYHSLGTSITFISSLLPPENTILDMESGSQFPLVLRSTSSIVSDITYQSDDDLL
jgi:hypothetical protein